MFSNKSEENVKVKMLKANNRVDWSGDRSRNCNGYDFWKIRMKMFLEA